MGISHRVEHRHGGTVLRLHHRAQRFPGCPVGLDPSLFRLLKISYQRELLQRLGNLRRPQGSRVQRLQKLVQRLHIHVELIGVLVPDAIGAFAQGAPLPLLGGILESARQHRPCGTSAGIRIVMSRIGLHQHVKTLALLAAGGEHIVLHEMVRLTDPVGAVCAEAFPVDEQRGLPARVQIHDDALALGFLRKRHRPSEPAVLPEPSPGKSRFHRLERRLLGLLKSQILHRRERFPGNLSQRLIEIVFQGADPMRDSPSPF